MKRLLLVPCALAVGALAVACSDTNMPTPPAATASISEALAHVLPPGTAMPSGERTIGQTTIEPVYDADDSAAIGYVSTPAHAIVHADSNSWAPFYVVMYPTGTEVDTLECAHLPADNCPDHGPELAGLAETYPPAAAVYANGVAGHDHVMSFPGGSDFNIAWEPIAVLFTNSAAADTDHLVTSAQIQAAVSAGDAVLVPLPTAVFHCAPVSVAVWNRATPVTPVTE